MNSDIEQEFEMFWKSRYPNVSNYSKSFSKDALQYLQKSFPKYSKMDLLLEKTKYDRRKECYKDLYEEGADLRFIEFAIRLVENPDDLSPFFGYMERRQKKLGPNYVPPQKKLEQFVVDFRSMCAFLNADFVLNFTSPNQNISKGLSLLPNFLEVLESLASARRQRILKNGVEHPFKFLSGMFENEKTTKAKTTINFFCCLLHCHLKGSGIKNFNYYIYKIALTIFFSWEIVGGGLLDSINDHYENRGVTVPLPRPVIQQVEKYISMIPTKHKEMYNLAARIHKIGLEKIKAAHQI